MFGKLLSSVVKIATLPVDVANITLDTLTGGDGSKESREDVDVLNLEKIRDEVAETLEGIDE